MLSSRPYFFLAALCAASGISDCTAAPAQTALPRPAIAADSLPGVSVPTLYLPGREADARVAQIVYRLATAGLPRCLAPDSTAGLVLQHLSQFQLADRAALVATLPLDRGPAVIAVVAGGPAAAAGFQAGDILLAIGGTALPPEPGLSEPFLAARAHDRADVIYDLLDSPAPMTVTVLRGGREVSVRLASRPACPSRVHLARSGQRNAYADGRHVFLTTGMLGLLHNDDELAFIIAHEMSHNILGHAAIMRGAMVRKGLGRTLGQSGQTVRGTETAADALGAELMLDAGFDPMRGLAILTRLGGGDFGIALLATHEPAGKRVAAVRAIVQARRSQ